MSETRGAGFIAAHIAWVGSVSILLFASLRKLGLLRLTDAMLAASIVDETLDASVHGYSPCTTRKGGAAFAPALPAISGQVRVLNPPVEAEDAQAQAQSKS